MTFNPFRKNQEPTEPHLSDEEIAAYFPGTVPVLQDPADDHLESLRFTSEGWESTTPGVVFVIAGSVEHPDPEKLLLAKAVLGRFAEVEASAKQVTRTFIRDEGSWSVEEINFGERAATNECDFLVHLSFSPNDGSAKYEYTCFAVCFAVAAASKRATTDFYVRKYVVEFL